MIYEPCQPYTFDWRNNGRPAVDVFTIIDRLTRDEQRQMLMAFAVHSPDWFEDKLMRVWAER